MANPTTASGKWPARYELLDGLRGLAALAVVLHHLKVYDWGHFAVMIFFVISGYCITASAESCRRNSLGFVEFMRRRITRIYPPYWFALLFYAITRAVKLSLGGPDELRHTVMDWVQNLTLTQWLSTLMHPVHWPSDNPHLFVTSFWSLNYEEQFYLIAALGLLLATVKRLPLIVPVLVLALAGLAWNWVVPGNWVTGFFLEYWLHFALGSTLYFVLCAYTDLRSRWLFVGIVFILGLASAARLLPWNPSNATDLRSMVEIAFLAAATLALFALRPLSQRISSSWLWRPVAALGTVSYSLYLIHQFNLNLIASAAHHLVPTAAPTALVILVMAVLHIALASGFWYFFERPFLRSRPARSPPVVSVASPA